jgi:hypothetical protein
VSREEKARELIRLREINRGSFGEIPAVGFVLEIVLAETRARCRLETFETDNPRDRSRNGSMGDAERTGCFGDCRQQIRQSLSRDLSSKA